MKIALALAVLFLSSACFQAVAPASADGGKPVQTADFCSDFAAATCDRQIRCGQTSDLYRGECQALARLTCSPGRRVADPQKAAACLAGLGGACQGEAAPADCAHVLHGSVPSGGACQTPWECLSPDESCGGARCLQTCVAAGALAQPCRQDQRCDDGLRCDWPTKTCQLPKVPGPAGTSCPAGPADCDDTAYCDFSKTQCVALPVAGSACRSVSPRCTGATWCDGSTCQPRYAEAKACSSTASCHAGLYCDITCQPRRSAGATCSSAEQCSSELRCIAGICAAALEEGARCTRADQCSPNLSCDRVTRTCTGLAFTTRLGGPCTNDLVYCGAGLECEGALEDPTGVPGTLGSCRPTRSCVCGPNAWCDTSGGNRLWHCEALKVDGEPCSAAGQCVHACVPRKNGAPTCGSLGELGESCGFSKVLEHSCVFPLQCEGQGTCQHAGGDGESCLGGSTCFFGGCTAQGLCGPKLPEGSTCTSGSACQSGACLDRGCTAVCGG